jgi:hypothetical protein
MEARGFLNAGFMAFGIAARTNKFAGPRRNHEQ